MKSGGFALLVVFLLSGAVSIKYFTSNVRKGNGDSQVLIVNQEQQAESSEKLSIEYMRRQTYPGSGIKIEKELQDGGNYKRYITSFYSDGLKQYAYLTIPMAPLPADGYPVIVFNHGYQVPELYTPEGNYIRYMDSLASEGYIIFKPDFRGNGKSQGKAGSAYFSTNYAVDVLNAISSIKTLHGANTNRLGLWGHSMGGHISLRVAEVESGISAVVIWGGVVGEYDDIINNWQNSVTYKPDAQDLNLRNLGLEELLNKYGQPRDNPAYWNSLDPFYNLAYIEAPFQIHVGLLDNQVPPIFSTKLYQKLISNKKSAEYYEYENSNHDIAQDYSAAMERTIVFFNKNLKGIK